MSGRANGSRFGKTRRRGASPRERTRCVVRDGGDGRRGRTTVAVPGMSTVRPRRPARQSLELDRVRSRRPRLPWNARSASGRAEARFCHRPAQAAPRAHPVGDVLGEPRPLERAVDDARRGGPRSGRSRGRSGCGGGSRWPRSRGTAGPGWPADHRRQLVADADVAGELVAGGRPSAGGSSGDHREIPAAAPGHDRRRPGWCRSSPR